jgi:hypothetical protein
MFARALVLMLLFAGLAGAEILDSVAAFVGNRAIKQSEIERDLRLTAFLNGSKLDFSAASKRQAAERLIDQALIRDEIAKAKYPMAGTAEVAPVLNKIKKLRFGAESEYQRALTTYGVAEADLRAQLAWQITVVRFIDVRFPAPGKPAAEAAERANQAFFAWLAQSRKAARIHFGQELSE